MYDENLKFLVNYYNHDRGTDLPAEPNFRFPYRAVCANIAWCMVNKDRFWEYYNKSEYWRVKLITAARQFGVKFYEHGVLGNENDLNNLTDEVYKYLYNEIGKKIYMRPSDLDYNLDIATIFIMLIQAKAGIY